MPTNRFLPFRLCSPFLQTKSRSLCVWQMPGSCSGILGPDTRDSLKGSCRMGSWKGLEGAGRDWKGLAGALLSSTPSLWAQPALQPWHERSREGKLFAVNFCKHIREWCKHLICTVWDVISAGSQGKTFLSCWQSCTHVETRHPHQ